ncbi:transcription termination/antitermination protein NusG [Adhaeretor mobilis]|uniref:Transcriptional activator RfaH n=1 Tax=Adhaeretor mobilis TaxID=1930276 RepID=A0A517MQ83_9BACT|nr:transcription termination/antitermination NusG family protein [Adhaeretor mobilis]QDS96947.1 transcriptional activator RfaH [Adhaeretor mobilis]
MLRLKDNPPMTLPSLPALADAPGCWTAAYCKPRQEKALAWELCRGEVPYFLPMILRETYSGSRRRSNLYPMFTSYVFFAGGDSERLVVQKSHRTVGFLEIDPAAQASFSREISSLELALRTAPKELELYPQLVTGKRVAVIGGPMKGAEGIVLNADNPARLWIGVTMMGAGAKVELHADLLSPLSDESEEVAERVIELPVGLVGDGKHVATRRSQRDSSEFELTR